jgi:outer membrane lipoprotein-sorting protein
VRRARSAFSAFCALALLLACSGGARAAAPPTLDELIARLEASSKDVRSLSGEFSQRNKLKLFKQ